MYLRRHQRKAEPSGRLDTVFAHERLASPRVDKDRPKWGKVPEIGANAVISPIEHNELRRRRWRRG